ncbi:hypothetical protein [Marinobacterium aestuarii]|nr:hypothetical protein [Marinobacterium aestuarii]
MKQSMHADPQDAADSATPESLSLIEAAAGVFATTRQHLAQLLTLLTLEARYAGLMLGMTLAMALIGALAAFSAWGLLLAAALGGLLALGWSWSLALGSLALANVVLALISLWLMRRALTRISLGSTRQALGLDLPNDAD